MGTNIPLKLNQNWCPFISFMVSNIPKVFEECIFVRFQMSWSWIGIYQTINIDLKKDHTILFATDIGEMKRHVGTLAQ